MLMDQYTRMVINLYSENEWPTATHINKSNLKTILLNEKKSSYRRITL